MMFKDRMKIPYFDHAYNLYKLNFGERSISLNHFYLFDHIKLSIETSYKLLLEDISKWNISVQFISVAQSCPTLCDPMNRNTPGLPVHHQLLELTQTHVHRVSDAIQPSHPLLSPSPAPNPFQHHSLFQ